MKETLPLDFFPVRAGLGSRRRLFLEAASLPAAPGLDPASGRDRTADLRMARRGDVRGSWDELPTLEGGPREYGAPREEPTEVRAGVDARDDGA